MLKLQKVRFFTNFGALTSKIHASIFFLALLLGENQYGRQYGCPA